MRLFFRKKQKPKTAPARGETKGAAGDVSVFVEEHGYDPYETADIVPSDTGMRRRRSGKWSF